MNGKITRTLVLLALSLTATTGYSNAGRSRTPPPQTPCCENPIGVGQGHGAYNYMEGGYNAPARYEVNGCWNFFITADFIYWQPRQENMGLANAMPLGSPVPPIVDSTIIYQKFSWKPGFRVGLGMNFGHDNWAGLVEYTWFHNTHRTSSDEPNFDNGGGLVMLWASGLFLNTENTGLADGFNSRWDLDMDLLDFVLQRIYYVGTKLSFRTFFGGRATWISQDMDFNFLLNPLTNPLGLSTVNSIYYSSSWALGPRFGTDLTWMIGWGFSLASKLAGDISYARYKVNWNEDEVRTGGGPGQGTHWTVSQLRPHAEASFGLGWGTYFCDKGFHLQFTATYDFNVWWNQNMMKALQGYVNNLQEVQGNLYTHGVDLKVQFDF